MANILAAKMHKAKEHIAARKETQVAAKNRAAKRKKNRVQKIAEGENRGILII